MTGNNCLVYPQKSPVDRRWWKCNDGTRQPNQQLYQVLDDDPGNSSSVSIIVPIDDGTRIPQKVHFSWAQQELWGSTIYGYTQVLDEGIMGHL